MRVPVGPVDVHRDAHGDPAESSAEVSTRVATARARQRARFQDAPWSLNAQIPGPLPRREFAPRAEDARLLDRAVEAGRLTLRGHDRVPRLAWTLADLDATDRPSAEHIGHALALRGGGAR